MFAISMIIEHVIKSELRKYPETNAIDGLSRRALYRLMQSLARAFAAENPEFNTPLFFKACGLKPHECAALLKTA
jgi:hypothetical protein